MLRLTRNRFAGGAETYHGEQFVALEHNAKKKVILAGALAVIAVGIGTYQVMQSRISQAEIRDSVRGQTYIVCCEACDEQFDMDAVAYMDAIYAAGTGNYISCQLCGANNAWKCGDRAVDPTPDGLDQFDLTSLAGIEDAKRSLNADYADLQDELRRVDPSDQARIDELKEEIKGLDRRRAYLDDRWDEEAMKQAGGR